MAVYLDVSILFFETEASSSYGNGLRAEDIYSPQ